MNLLPESEHYKVYCEYEKVIMEIKKTNKRILIGDFMETLKWLLYQKTKNFAQCVAVELSYII